MLCHAQRKAWGKKQCIFFLLLYSISVCFLYLKLRVSNDPKYCRTFDLKDSWSWHVKNHHRKFQKEIEEKFANISGTHNSSDSIYSTLKRWVQLSPDIYVYSAYVTSCEDTDLVLLPLCVKLIGITSSNRSDLSISESDIKCAFKSKNGIVSMIGFAAIEKLPESHDEAYSAAVFYCALQNDREKSNLPSYVSIYEGTKAEVIWTKVENIHDDSMQTVRGMHINVCVRPIYNQIPIISLVEFISYYSIIGVEHFKFYYINRSEVFFKFVNFARALNVSIEISKWNVLVPENRIHSFGQLAFIQDCIASSAHDFSHTTIVDFDEYIVPKKHADLKQLLGHLDRVNSRAASYVIPNIFFCKEFPVNNFSGVDIFTYTKRQTTVWQYWYRSKYILKPSKVLQGGVHFVWKHKGGHEEYRVPPSDALLHHYRWCCGLLQTWFLHLLSFSVLDDRLVVDESLIMMRDKVYSHGLFKSVLSRVLYDELNGGGLS